MFNNPDPAGQHPVSQTHRHTQTESLGGSSDQGAVSAVCCRELCSMLSMTTTLLTRMKWVLSSTTQLLTMIYSNRVIGGQQWSRGRCLLFVAGNCVPCCLWLRCCWRWWSEFCRGRQDCERAADRWWVGDGRRREDRTEGHDPIQLHRARVAGAWTAPDVSCSCCFSANFSALI